MKIYSVGGQVRDRLMNRESVDRDYLVVGATPEQMLEQSFEAVGAAFPVFLHPVTRDEYALARTETKIGEGYQGFACRFGPDVTLEQDLFRRDITINSIAYDDKTGEYFDPCNGRVDIENKVLRHTSAAFSEDPLRVIRLARFFARFDDFTIHQDTVKLACTIVESGEMDTLSFERYWAELMKVMSDAHPNVVQFLSALCNFGALDKCAFFKDVFGATRWDVVLTANVGLDYEQYLAKVAAYDPELAVAILVALFENNAPLAHQAVPTRVLRLVKNVRGFEYDGDAYAVYNALAATRSLNEKTEALTDLISFFGLNNNTDVADELELGFKVVSKISAEPFMHLAGPEIGKALKQARLDALKVALA